MSKVLLFDFDGTIADSLENFIEILGKLSRKYNLPTLSRDELEKLREEEPRAIIARLKIPFYIIPLLARDMKNMQQEYIAELTPCKGLPEVLRMLKSKGYVLGILTSNGKENVEAFLKNNNLEIFTYLYSDSSLFGKHTVIRKFLKQHSISRENVIYIGDEIRDIQACQRAGIKIIAVSWGLNVKEGLKKHDPDFLIDAPQELSKILAEQ